MEKTEEILKAAAEHSAELREPQVFYNAASLVIRQNGKEALSKVAEAYDTYAKEMADIGIDGGSGFSLPVLVSGEQKCLSFIRQDTGINACITNKDGNEEVRLGEFSNSGYRKISNADFIPGDLTEGRFADEFRRVCNEIKSNTKDDTIQFDTEFGRASEQERADDSENPVVMSVKAVRRHPIEEYRSFVNEFVNKAKETLLAQDESKGSHGLFRSRESMEQFMEGLNGTKSAILERMQTNLGSNITFNIMLNSGKMIEAVNGYGKSVEEQLGERFTIVPAEMVKEVTDKLQGEMNKMADRIFAAEAVISADKAAKEAEKNGSKDTRLYDLYNASHPDVAAKYNEFNIELCGNLQPTIGLDQNGAAVDLPGAKTEVYAVNIKMTETREINQAIEDMKRTGLIETCQRESGSMATERSIGIDPGSKLRVAMPEPQKITLKSMACAIAEGARGVKKFLLEASLKAITNISDYNKVNRTLCEAHRIIGKIKVKDLKNTKNIQDKALAPLIRQTRYDKTAIILEMDSYNADGKYGTTVGHPETAYLKFDNGIVTIQWAGREEPATPEMAANAFVEYYQRHQYELADNTKQRHFVATKGINSYTNKEIGITARTGGTLGDLGALIEEAGKKAKNRAENRTQPEANRGNKTPGDERT